MVSVNGMKIIGGWRVSDGITLVFTSMYVDLLPKTEPEARPEGAIFQDSKFVVD
jgi:hypothetical protein